MSVFTCSCLNINSLTCSPTRLSCCCSCCCCCCWWAIALLRWMLRLLWISKSLTTSLTHISTVHVHRVMKMLITTITVMERGHW